MVGRRTIAVRFSDHFVTHLSVPTHMHDSGGERGPVLNHMLNHRPRSDGRRENNGGSTPPDTQEQPP